MNKTNRITNMPALVVGLGLILVAVVTAFDASTMRVRGGYGMGPQSTSFLIAAFLALLGLAHLPAALRNTQEETPVAVGWLGLALGGLIAVIAAGGGFIAGSSLLFVFTARAFGRKAILVDAVIGFVLAVLVFLLFNKLLSLTLPMGPLERLI